MVGGDPVALEIVGTWNNIHCGEVGVVYDTPGPLSNENIYVFNYNIIVWHENGTKMARWQDGWR